MYDTNIHNAEDKVEVVEAVKEVKEVKPVAMKKFVIRRTETLKTTAALYDELCWGF